ncbi:unnamed protein product [Hermetia illucens]|uniref:Uncharacterized protein n=2 Tax=Hermetia illucens TaxID=343691 RepID=A0A7R8UL54_HERIL|nr:unnamed protein product [Hermetia illucens]
MFKLVVLSALVAVAFARPGYVSHLDTPLVYDALPAHHQEYVEIQEPTVAKVGAIVESVPSAVSHQSSTVVHSKAHVVTPILAHGVKTHHIPLVKSYETAHITPIVDAYDTAHIAPVLSSYGGAHYAADAYGYDADDHYHHHY